MGAFGGLDGSIGVTMDKAFNRFSGDMNTISRRIASRKVPIVRRTLKAIVATYKANAPDSGSKPDSTYSDKFPSGSMRSQVTRRAWASAGGAAGRITVAPYYARMVESGTVERKTKKGAARGKVTAQYPLQHALDAHEGEILKAFGRIMELR